MIVCVTPNAAIDRTLVAPGYSAGGVFRATQELAAAGGKGINVARAARILGAPAVCAGFLGGFAGGFVAQQVAGEGLDARWTALGARETRTCTILLDPDAGLTTVVNERGPQVTAADWAALRADVLALTVAALAAGAAHACFCGSLPPGSPPDGFGALLAELVEMGAGVWVDTSGPALAAAAAVPGVNLKVNEAEAGALLGRPLDDPDSVVEAARELRGRTGGAAAVTLGARGAVFASAGGVWRAVSPPIAVQSAVGSGDSFLAGLLAALLKGDDGGEALRAAVAAGTANALSVGGGSFAAHDYARLLAGVEVSATR